MPRVSGTDTTLPRKEDFIYVSQEDSGVLGQQEEISEDSGYRLVLLNFLWRQVCYLFSVFFTILKPQCRESYNVVVSTRNSLLIVTRIIAFSL